MGRMTSVLKPVADRYNQKTPNERYQFRRQVRNLIKWYGYISQILRMFDKELHKEYVFCCYLINLLPAETTDMVDLEGMRSHSIVTCSEIFEEIKDKEIKEWIFSQQCTVLEIDDDIQNNVRKIVTENPKMIEFTGKSGTSSGDAFLIATAMKYGLIIITEENKDKQMKIPQISKKYGITSVNITSLCEMEQWKF